jgi:hypothetical protein
MGGSAYGMPRYTATPAALMKPCQNTSIVKIVFSKFRKCYPNKAARHADNWGCWLAMSF